MFCYVVTIISYLTSLISNTHSNPPVSGYWKSPSFLQQLQVLTTPPPKVLSLSPQLNAQFLQAYYAKQEEFQSPLSASLSPPSQLLPL